MVAFAPTIEPDELVSGNGAMRCCRWGLLLGAMLLALGCRQANSVPVVPPAGTVQEDNALGPGDVFEVTVYGEEDLSGKHQVSGDGTINFPLLGTVKVVGLEPSAVAGDLADGLREGNFLVSPHVSIQVLESNSRRLSVVGAVAKPSTFAYVPGMTLVQAISLAGGFSSLADRSSTVLTRRNDGKLERYRIDVQKISSGELDDVLLRPGDLVFVPERVF